MALRSLSVLVTRSGALGDLILLRMAIAGLRAAGHRVSLLVPESPGKVLLGPGEADLVLPSDGAEVAAALASGFAGGPVARAVAGADAVVAYTRSPELVARLRERASRVIVHDPTPGPGLHAARWLARAVEPLTASGASRASAGVPALAFTDSERAEAAARTEPLPSRFLAVHPGSGSPAKDWPLDRFYRAARALAGDRPWLLVVGPAEAQRVGAPPPGAVLAREWPPRVLGAVLAQCGLYLGNDSGVSHLAAAAGGPTLALFGPTDPAVWSPVGPRVEALRAPDGSLDRLETAAVIAAAERLRSAASRPPSG